MRTAHIEAEIDRAKNRLSAIEQAEGDAQDAIRAAVRALQEAVGADHKDARYTIERIEEELADFTLNARSSVEREIGDAEQALSDIEYADLERSRPVVL